MPSAGRSYAWRVSAADARGRSGRSGGRLWRIRDSRAGLVGSGLRCCGERRGGVPADASALPEADDALAVALEAQGEAGVRALGLLRDARQVMAGAGMDLP